MKKLLVVLGTMFLFVFISGPANAALTTIGTAGYEGGNYNLIYDDEQELVWLNYYHNVYGNEWQDEVDWASGLGGRFNGKPQSRVHDHHRLEHWLAIANSGRERH